MATTNSLTLRSWLTLLASFCILTVSFSFGLFSLPVFYPVLVKQFMWNRASVAAGGSIALLLIGTFSPVVGWLVDRYKPKAVLIAGTCAVAVALLLLSTATTLPTYYAYCFLLGLGGSAASILPNSILIAPFFAKGRASAVGFINAGIGLGGFVAPQLANARIQADGYGAAFITLALWMALPLLLTLLFVRNPEGVVAPSRHAGSLRAPAAGELFRMPMFWIFGLAIFLSAHAMLAIQQHLVLYLTGQGVPARRAALVLAVVLAATAAGKLLNGALADKFSARLGMMVAVLCVALGIASLLTIPVASDLLFAFAAIFGLGYGGIFNVSPTIVFEYFGTHQVGKVLGFFLVFFGLGTSSGGLLAGYIVDQTHRYSLPFTLDLAVAGAALLLLLASARLTRPVPPVQAARLAA
jgi:MFS family permease